MGGLCPPLPPVLGHLVQDPCCRESCLRAVAGSLAFLSAKGRPGMVPDRPLRLTSGEGWLSKAHSEALPRGRGEGSWAGGRKAPLD